MDSNLLKTKSLEQLCQRRRARRQGAQAHADGLRPDTARHRRHHRHRHLRADRHRGGQPGGSGHRRVVSGRRPRLRVCGPVLRRVRLDDPHRGQRLYLRVRHARRDLRVDDRLGPHSRVRGRVDDRRRRLERVFPADPRRLRPAPAGVDDGVAVGDGRRGDQPAGRDHRAVHHGAARRGRPRERALQRGDGRHQAGGRAVLHRRRRHVRQARQLVAVHAVRLLGRDGRGGRRLFRLHRV